MNFEWDSRLIEIISKMSWHSQQLLKSNNFNSMDFKRVLLARFGYAHIITSILNRFILYFLFSNNLGNFIGSDLIIHSQPSNLHLQEFMLHYISVQNCFSLTWDVRYFLSLMHFGSIMYHNMPPSLLFTLLDIYGIVNPQKMGDKNGKKKFKGTATFKQST